MKPRSISPPRGDLYIEREAQRTGRLLKPVISKFRDDFLAFVKRQEEKYTKVRQFNFSTELTKKLATEMPQNELEAMMNEYNIGIVTIVENKLKQSILRGAEPEIYKYQDFLKGWGVSFNLPTDDAVKYLDNFKNFNLSDYQGAISHTTKNEIRLLVQDAIATGEGWSALAEKINNNAPYIFSPARGVTIARTEIGRAYGFGTLLPAQEMDRLGYPMVKIWINKDDPKVRPTHRANSMQGYIDLKRYWTATGDLQAPSTHDVNCRCYMTTRIA